MRDAKADIAEALSSEGWLTVLDGPLHGIRHRRGLPVFGYVKTHHRRMLTREHWVRVPELTAGERSGLFAMGDALYGCYLRVGDPGVVGGPLGGHRPPRRCRQASAATTPVEAAERAAGWAARLRLGSAPGRAGPGEPDADRGTRTASAPAAEGHTPRVARGARGSARTQPRRTHGMTADCRPPAHRGPSATSNHRAVRARQPHRRPRRRTPLRGSPGVRPPSPTPGPPNSSRARPCGPRRARRRRTASCHSCRATRAGSGHRHIRQAALACSRCPGRRDVGLRDIVGGPARAAWAPRSTRLVFP